MSGLRWGIVRHTIECNRWRVIFYRCVALLSDADRARAVADADAKHRRKTLNV